MVIAVSVGPFILLEYCVHGQLNEYLEEIRERLNVATMECLFRFGVGVARGMEYLASKDVGFFILLLVVRTFKIN